MTDSYSTFTLQTIDGRRAGQGSLQVLKEQLPEAPGIYVWTRRLDDPNHLQGTARLRTVEANQGFYRDKRPDIGQAGRYRRVAVFDNPHPLTPASHERLEALQVLTADDLTWVLFTATLLQRPLYIGKALNFRERIIKHFSHDSTFTRSLVRDGLDVTDCMVTLIPVAPAPNGTPFAPPGHLNDETDLRIRLAESLVIRGLHPIYNEKMD